MIQVSLDELVSLLTKKQKTHNYPLVQGKFYLFRTVTMIYTGELYEQWDDCFVLKKAAWIADTGRWADNVVSCEFNEVEPYPDDKDVLVYRSGVLDVVEISKLPRKQK